MTINSSIQLPPELTSKRQWVVWRMEYRVGQQTKVPYQTDGRRAKANDPATWTSFEDAVQALDRDSDMTGIGFVFSDNDGFFGVDLDGCLDCDAGGITSWAKLVLDKVSGFTEISPSGCGLKITARGSFPADFDRTGLTFKQQHLGIEAIAGCDKEPEIAIWQTRRFWAMTGEVYDGRADIGPDPPH